MSLRALASRTRTSPGFLSQLERGQVNASIGTLRKLAERLGVTLPDLFTDVDTDRPRTNLAGRTLADLVLRRDTELTRLPWVGRRVRQWEPEPLHRLGVQAMYTLYRTADRREYRRDLPRTSRIARVANMITGR